MPGPIDCELCDVAAGRRDTEVVFLRNEAAVGFVGAFRHPGHGVHVLVVCSSHVADLHDLAGLVPAAAGPLLEAVALASRALLVVAGASGTTVVQHNGPPGQEVPHLHFHVVARLAGDGGIAAGWEPVDPAERLVAAARLRAEVERTDPFPVVEHYEAVLGVDPA